MSEDYDYEIIRISHVFVIKQTRVTRQLPPSHRPPIAAAHRHGPSDRLPVLDPGADFRMP